MGHNSCGKALCNVEVKIDEPNEEGIGENTKESNNNSDSRQKFVTILSRKRGRKSISQNTKIHQSTDYDNTLSKIQCHYLTFIINLSNDILKSLNLPYDFKQIDYNIKKKVNHPFFCKLRDYSIRNILELDISPKFSTYDKDINKKTLDELSKLSDLSLDTFFKMNYLDLFKNYYFKIDNPLSKITKLICLFLKQIPQFSCGNKSKGSTFLSII